MTKQLNVAEGQIISVSELIHIPRNAKAPINKRTVGLKTIDNQIIYFELRDNLEKEIVSGQRAEVKFYFAGSCKEGKTYNNIVATNINIYGF